jgi:hypothetical protein
METEMTTNHDDFAAKAAAIDAKWRDHLAEWARRELRRRGMHMTREGKIRPAPVRQPRRPAAVNGVGESGTLR